MFAGETTGGGEAATGGALEACRTDCGSDLQMLSRESLWFRYNLIAKFHRTHSGQYEPTRKIIELKLQIGEEETNQRAFSSERLPEILAAALKPTEIMNTHTDIVMQTERDIDLLQLEDGGDLIEHLLRLVACDI
ncbi:hypothetical protein JCGZ_21637 [Jatropha curcas]|uniref:Uncharacterized protein n=1 Tax=Jatropha curcas TaxID=180498 RepID=A0A067JBI5_JATCU|nr:hypothetical protein JCGZ_21637 [Jatropha curcas]